MEYLRGFNITLESASVWSTIQSVGGSIGSMAGTVGSGISTVWDSVPTETISKVAFQSLDWALADILRVGGLATLLGSALYIGTKEGRRRYNASYDLAANAALNQRGGPLHNARRIIDGAMDAHCGSLGGLPHQPLTGDQDNSVVDRTHPASRLRHDVIAKLKTIETEIENLRGGYLKHEYLLLSAKAKDALETLKTERQSREARHDELCKALTDTIVKIVDAKQLVGNGLTFGNDSASIKANVGELLNQIDQQVNAFDYNTASSHQQQFDAISREAIALSEVRIRQHEIDKIQALSDVLGIFSVDRTPSTGAINQIDRKRQQAHNTAARIGGEKTWLVSVGTLGAVIGFGLLSSNYLFGRDWQDAIYPALRGGIVSASDWITSWTK